jgi:hypothetical protein
VPSGFDRTHVASAALTYDFGAGFRGGLRSLFYTGAPIIRRPEGEPILVKERLPPFFRTDWRFEKRFSIADTGFISIVAEMQNTFLAAETIGEDCRGGIFEPLVCGPEVIGPVVIPSLGVEGGF